MPEKDRTFKPSDMVLIWGLHLNRVEQLETVIFFQYIVRDFVEDLISRQTDFLDDSFTLLLRGQRGPAALAVRFLRRFLRPVSNIERRFVLLALSRRTRRAIMRITDRNNPFLNTEEVEVR